MGTRTLTATEAHVDDALWEDVKAQRVEVTDDCGRIIGRPIATAPDSDPWFERGEFQWLFKPMGFGVIPANKMFTVRDMDPGEQSSNAPAVVERMQSTIDALDAFARDVLETLRGEWTVTDDYDAQYRGIMGKDPR